MAHDRTVSRLSQLALTDARGYAASAIREVFQHLYQRQAVLTLEGEDHWRERSRYERAADVYIEERLEVIERWAALALDKASTSDQG